MPRILMTTSRLLEDGHFRHPARPARVAAAWLLRSAGAALDRAAQRLASDSHRLPDAGSCQVEFHAEAGAPEGALYVDGHLVGWLDGVTRL